MVNFRLDIDDIGNDGGCVTDWPIYQYALALWADTLAPTILKPCFVDGQPQMYCCAYQGDKEIDGWARDKRDGVRARVALGLLVRADHEAREIDGNPSHPSRRRD